jgi:hypothetical protein
MREEFAENAARAQEISALAENTSLFSIDRAGSQAKRRRVEEELLPKKQGKFISKTEQRLIQRTLEKNRKQYGSDIVERKAANSTTEPALSDLWNDSEELVHKQPRLHHKSVKLPLPGQSYHPTAKDHQDVIAQAVAIEMKKEAEKIGSLPAIEDSTSIVGNINHELKQQRLKEMTAVILGDQPEIEFDEDEDEDDGLENDGALRKKRKQRVLTKAERNKRRERKHAQHIASQQEQRKQQLKDLSRLDRLQEEINAEEAERQFKQQVKEAELAQAATNTDPELPVHDVSAVALSDELHGSLRQMIPKGTAVSERLQAMISVGETAAPFTRKRRAYEKPHAAKRIKWFPKYKAELGGQLGGQLVASMN